MKRRPRRSCVHEDHECDGCGAEEGEHAMDSARAPSEQVQVQVQQPRRALDVREEEADCSVGSSATPSRMAGENHVCQLSVEQDGTA